MMNVWTITDAATIDRNNLPSEWNIDLIRDITETEAQIMAEKHEIIKGHDIYFIDLKGAFGYSYVTFKNGHHLRYAADYQLHHSHRSRAELNEYYLKSLKSRLFPEAEFYTKIKDYHEYRARRNYLTNYYSDMENHISCFGIFSDPEFKARYEAETKDLHFNHYTFSYCRSLDFIYKCAELDKALKNALEATRHNFEFWKKAFRYEFANYECIYGGRYNEAAGDANDGKPLNHIQKRAYKEAKREYENYYYDNDLI